LIASSYNLHEAYFYLIPYSDYSLFSASKSFKKEEDDDCFLPPARKSKPFGIQRILSTEHPVRMMVMQTIGQFLISSAFFS